MGSKEPLHDPGVSHGICSACVERQSLADTPVLVVSPARASTIPLLNTLLRGAPDIAIVVDRRNGERRIGSNGNGNGNGHRLMVSDDRRVDERRRGTALYLV
jgi:hypothetical protein